MGFYGGDVERFEGFDMSWPVSLMEVRGVREVHGKGEMVGEGVGEREKSVYIDARRPSLIFDVGLLITW